MHRALIVTIVLLAAALTGCAGTTADSGGGRLQIVAAENSWGSIASQLVGSKGRVTSIITSPAADPHTYDPTVADAKSVSGARLVIANGLGYDTWMSKLLDASPAPNRATLTVGSLLHLKDGDNPHRWYRPADVAAVAARITADLTRVDPRNAAYYERQGTTFERDRLAPYHAAIAEIRRRYAGTPVGASESIFALLAPALGLHLITPSGFMDAITEGRDLSAQDTVTTQDQIARRQIKVWIYNDQNITPEIERLNALARAHQVPVSTISETLVPAAATFQQWQTRQLAALAAALHTATGR